MSLPSISPSDAQQRLAQGEAVLIDIRSPDEYARECIACATLAPLDGLEQHDFKAYQGKTVIFHCRSGQRTRLNVQRLAALGLPNAYCLEGGLDGWRTAGLPVKQDHKQPLELMRQVQIGIGILLVVGLVLSHMVSPWFDLLVVGVALGILTAGVTGVCGMARVLMLMPWNRRLSR